MNETTRETYLRYALYVIGAVFIVGIYLMMSLWPAAWTWEPRQPEYEQMILGIYAVLGLFLVRAARNPPAHASLIWFTIWSSIVHAGIMLVQAIMDENERANLLGDVPGLFLVAAVLWYLMPRRRAV